MRSLRPPSFAVLLAASLLAGLPGCGEDEAAARLAVRNAFSNAQFTLVEARWDDAAFAGPIARGDRSEAAEVSPGLHHGHALAVWAYDPAATPPQLPLVLRTREKVEAFAGEEVELVFSEPSHLGKCGGLSKEEYEAIAAASFPGREVQPYDAIDCP